MTTESLTYKEIADRFGVQIASARKMVQRKHWQRTTGNDGQVRILVPIDALPSPIGLKDSHGDSRTDSPKDIHTRELELEIEKLKALLEAAEQDRDRWHLHAVRPWWKRITG